MSKSKKTAPKQKMIKLPENVAKIMGEIVLLTSEITDQCDFDYEDTPEELAASVSGINIEMKDLVELRNLLIKLENIAEEDERMNPIQAKKYDFQDLIEIMKSCNQNELQTIYDHGLSVQNHLKQLLDYINGHTQELPGWRLPDWLTEYKTQIKEKILPEDILLTYALYHDCGKPFCRTVDEQGKQHFPNHASASAKIWRDHGGDEQIARLIELDMEIHLLKAEKIDEFCKYPEAISLLLSGLAEVHANATMFGGIESTSFKIKWKHIEKRGKQICKKLLTPN